MRLFVGPGFTNRQTSEITEKFSSGVKYLILDNQDISVKNYVLGEYREVKHMTFEGDEDIYSRIPKVTLKIYEKQE